MNNVEQAKHTPGPWHWRTGENGEGGTATSLVGSPDEWVRCEYWCGGWPPGGSEASRGPVGKPGHEHNRAPTILEGFGWHGSGDLIINLGGPDARLIAAAPELLDVLQQYTANDDALEAGLPFDTYTKEYNRIYALARAAIAKATEASS